MCAGTVQIQGVKHDVLLKFFANDCDFDREVEVNGKFQSLCPGALSLLPPELGCVCCLEYSGHANMHLKETCGYCHLRCKLHRTYSFPEEFSSKSLSTMNLEPVSSQVPSTFTMR